jgi:hypothetical protein
MAADLSKIISPKLMPQHGVAALWRQAEPQLNGLSQQYHNVADALTLRKGYCQLTDPLEHVVSSAA